MTNRLPLPTPAEMLREEFLKPMAITAYQLAKDIRVPQTRISAILSGTRAITADTGLRLDPDNDKITAGLTSIIPPHVFEGV